MVIERYSIHLVSLDPTVGNEIKKSRPCVVISPDEMNRHLSTLIIAPVTTQPRAYPTRIPLTLVGKSGWIALDQIRTIDRARLVKKLGHLESKPIREIKSKIQEMLVD